MWVPGRVEALLQRAAVHDVVEVLRAEAEEAQQRVALRRRAVAHHLIAIGAKLGELGVQILLQPLRAPGELLPGLELVEAGGALRLEDRAPRAGSTVPSPLRCTRTRSWPWWSGRRSAWVTSIPWPSNSRIIGPSAQ